MSDQGNQVAWWTDFSGEVAAAMPAVVAATDAHQSASERFISEHGAAVVDGHGQVSGPGGGDPSTEFD